MQGYDSSVVNAILTDWRTAPVEENLLATLGYLEKLVSPTASVEEEDIMYMKAAGVTRLGMEEATLVAFCFQTLTRMADAMGWPLVPPANLDSAAHFLYKNGYVTSSLPG